MRIGMMADLYKPHVSGVTNYISLNKKRLEQQGHQVYVFTFTGDDYQDDEARVMRSPGLPLGATGATFSLRYTKAARELLQTMDVAHVHHPFLSGPLALLYCKPRGIPIIFTNHTRYDLYAQAYLPGVPEAVGLAALQAYLPSFCRSCDLVISPSPGVRDVLVRLGVDAPIEVAPNGVDLAPFNDACAAIDRATLGLAEDDVVLLYVGRLGPEKNLAFLLRSFAGAFQAYDHLRLVLIGGGPERANLEDQVQRSGLTDAVRLLGLIPYEEIPGYMAMADAFATASVTEVHPLTVIEAMAAGLPVLGIQSPGVGDMIEDGRTGYLAPEEDMAMFTAKMVRMAIDEPSRREMGSQARQEAQRYSIENTTRTMLGYYRQVVQQSAGRKRGWRVQLDRWLDRFRA
ncbi:MAG: glycosyltransferase [Chloroflexota bacterium]